MKMIASCYTMDIYCDNEQKCKQPNVYATMYGASRATYLGESFSECAKRARNGGWVIIKKTRQAYCPYCKKKL
jgi:hypothetical protein